MKRIELIDALRGFALLLILLFHSYGGFGTGVYGDEGILKIGKFDPFVTQFMFLFVIGKAFALFSIMFGFSFFIQMDRSSSKGEDFSLVFARRLFILLVIGYLHSLIYRGDILTKYAVIGFVLLLFSKFSNRVLIILAVLFLMQIPLIYSIIQSINMPASEISTLNDQAVWDNILAAYTSGSFIDVVRVNMWTAFIEIWKLNILSGRILLITGYFILGLLLGRSRFFENIEANRKYLRYSLLTGIMVYAALRILRSVHTGLTGLPPHTGEMISGLLNDYMDIFFTVALLSAFILIYQNSFVRRGLNLLVPYGRMGLTSYVSQGLIGIFVFYGFGLAFHKYSAPLFSVITGLAILAIQLLFSHFWLKHYAYGPIEWVWRSLTYPGRNIPLKRSSGRK